MAPPERAGTPLQNEPIVQPKPTVAPIAINEPPTNPFINSPTGGILKAKLFEKSAAIKEPKTIIIPSIPHLLSKIDCVASNSNKFINL